MVFFKIEHFFKFTRQNRAHRLKCLIVVFADFRTLNRHICADLLAYCLLAFFVQNLHARDGVIVVFFGFILNALNAFYVVFSLVKQSRRLDCQITSRTEQ